MRNIPQKTSLTPARIEALRPGERTYIVWDERLPGFGVRVGATRKSYVVQYRDGARKVRQPRVGVVGKIGLKEARTLAAKMMAEGAGTVREEPAAPEPTVADLVARYIAVEMPSAMAMGRMKEGTAKEYRRHLENHIVPTLGAMQAGDVKRRHVEAVVAKLPTYQRNRVLSTMRRLFNLAELWELVEPGRNPARGIVRGPEAARDRVLTDDEVRAFAEALTTLEADRPATVAAVRFLALSGLRISEAVGIRWEHVGADGALLLPDSKTGRRSHPLPTAAQTLLAAIKRRGPFVFTSTGTVPVRSENARKCFKRACAIAGIEGARPHDLRRGVISRAARKGASVPVLQAMLGHKTATMALRYAAQQQDVAATMRDAVAGEIAGAMGLPDNVIPLHRDAG